MKTVFLYRLLTLERSREIQLKHKTFYALTFKSDI